MKLCPIGSQEHQSGALETPPQIRNKSERVWPQLLERQPRSSNPARELPSPEALEVDDLSESGRCLTRGSPEAGNPAGVPLSSERIIENGRSERILPVPRERPPRSWKSSSGVVGPGIIENRRSERRPVPRERHPRTWKSSQGAGQTANH